MWSEQNKSPLFPQTAPSLAVDLNKWQTFILTLEKFEDKIIRYVYVSKHTVSKTPNLILNFTPIFHKFELFSNPFVLNQSSLRVGIVSGFFILSYIEKSRNSGERIQDQEIKNTKIPGYRDQEMKTSINPECKIPKIRKYRVSGSWFENLGS